MPCHHPSRMVQPPSGMKQQFAVCSSWSWRWCPGIRACFLSFFPFHLFFPAVPWSTVFVQHFSNGTLRMCRWMHV
jgi:hypothetical protein